MRVGEISGGALWGFDHSRKIRKIIIEKFFGRIPGMKSNPFI